MCQRVIGSRYIKDEKGIKLLNSKRELFYNRIFNDEFSKNKNLSILFSILTLLYCLVHFSPVIFH